MTGRQRRAPSRVVTSGVAAFGPAMVDEAFRRYDAQDYGEGEAGFAVYELAGTTVWLIDDAVRTSAGQPPEQDVSTSPGPQTLLLPSEY
jgi:hypothetical protein